MKKISFKASPLSDYLNTAYECAILSVISKISSFLWKSQI
jgi:hypothetical protein